MTHRRLSGLELTGLDALGRDIFPAKVLAAIHRMTMKVGVDRYMQALRAATPDEVLRDMYEEIISRDQAKKNLRELSEI